MFRSARQLTAFRLLVTAPRHHGRCFLDRRVFSTHIQSGRDSVPPHPQVHIKATNSVFVWLIDYEDTTKQNKFKHFLRSRRPKYAKHPHQDENIARNDDIGFNASLHRESTKSFGYVSPVVLNYELPNERWMVPEVAFLGRSNVGKSSLINALTKKAGNLAKVSKSPGRTQVRDGRPGMMFRLFDYVDALLVKLCPGRRTFFSPLAFLSTKPWLLAFVLKLYSK